jgi:hypothetical protein
MRKAFKDNFIVQASHMKWWTIVASN